MISVGVVANYFENKDVALFFSQLAHMNISITFFHPLRVFSLQRIQTSSIVLNEESFAVFEKNLFSDAKNFTRRLQVLSIILPSSFNNILRIVIHTDYSLPLWCWDRFRNAYLNTLPGLLDYIEKILHNINYKVVIEVHPGFTFFNNCRIKANAIVCESVEKSIGDLASCINEFGRGAKALRSGVDLCIEPRAGSIVRLKGKRRSEAQTLDNHVDAYLFAKSTGLKLVLDAGQTVGKYSSNAFDRIWIELYGVALHDPAIVEEVHVHSPLARRLRGHKLPDNTELAKFAGLIHYIVKSKSKTELLGIVYEVLNVSSERLVENIKNLLSLLSNTKPPQVP